MGSFGVLPRDFLLQMLFGDAGRRLGLRASDVRCLSSSMRDVYDCANTTLTLHPSALRRLTGVPEPELSLLV